MSRSTPLSNLQNMNKNQNQNPSHAYEEKENELVKEILQEIDSGKQPNQESLAQQAMAQQQQAMAQQQQAMAQQQQQQQQQQSKEELDSHMQEQELMHNQMLDNMSNEGNVKEQSMVDKIIEMVKQPLLVAVVAILISVPSLTNMLEGVINSKASLASYASIIILLVKGLIAGGLYFGINKSI